jgi:hypothetical protein
MENGIGKFSGLENFLVHAGIAASAAAIAAGCEDDDFTAGFSGLRVKMNGAGFEIEGAVHCVQSGVERKMYFGLYGVESQNSFRASCWSGLLVGRRGSGGEK